MLVPCPLDRAARRPPPVAARATAAAVPGARLVMIEGMGHTLPGALDERLAAEILHHTS
ncbi:hypothetical protein ACH4LS_32315 [Streptomyces luteogriseus]|uniref:hypothetical protein n=1 Tax=Streptomyces luteogriseus TaxID=68233 RepID=UPI00379BE6EE